MTRTRRIGALVVQVLFAHSMWVGSGVACTEAFERAVLDSPSAAGARGGMDGMPGMNMPGEPDAPEGQRPPGESPCGVPLTPATCQAMALCPSAALAAHEHASDVPSRWAETVALGAAQMPASPTIAPEPPPPKA